MNVWYKRVGGAALVIAGLALYGKHIHSLLNWPHLYPDLGKLSFGNLFFLGLTLVLAAFAWIAAAYLLLNAKERILHLLIPAAAFGVLLLLSGVCAAKAVGDIPCTNTSSLAAFREDFDSESFRVRGKALYPGFPMGELTGYSRYEKGEVLAERVVRSYDQDGFANESSRLEALDVPGVRYVTDPGSGPPPSMSCGTAICSGRCCWSPRTRPSATAASGCPSSCPPSRLSPRRSRGTRKRSHKKIG